jgi:hypothetical protein
MARVHRMQATLLTGPRKRRQSGYFLLIEAGSFWPFRQMLVFAFRLSEGLPCLERTGWQIKNLLRHSRPYLYTDGPMPPTSESEGFPKRYVQHSILKYTRPTGWFEACCRHGHQGFLHLGAAAESQDARHQHQLALGLLHASLDSDASQSQSQSRTSRHNILTA